MKKQQMKYEYIERNIIKLVNGYAVKMEAGGKRYYRSFKTLGEAQWWRDYIIDTKRVGGR